MSPKKSFREDIEGMRALAVISVVLFHIEKTLLPGGFLGVDIFFVISGFLITGILTKSVKNGTFKLSDFYRRRILRIIPVMLLVVAATMAVAALIMTPADLQDVARSGVSSIFFSANIYFTYFLDQSYFANDVATVPLLHLWSLGVEEQFYFFWPIIVFLAVQKLSIKMLLGICTIITVISFAYGQVILLERPQFAYYMLPSRAGELLTGAATSILLAGRLGNFLSSRSILNNGIWLVGLGLVALSITQLSEADPFPGINAIPVTLGTALMLATGHHSKTLVRPLVWAPVRYIGRISYSLYLWHWPVLAFLRYAEPAPSPLSLGLAFSVMLLLSVLSFHFVEQPFRKSSKGFGQVVSTRFLIPGGMISACASIVLSTNGLWPIGGKSYEQALASLANPQPAYTETFVCQRYEISDALLSSSSCVLGASSEPHVILWGDSNAAHWVGTLGEIAAFKGFGFRNVAHASCPPILENPGRFADEDHRPECTRSVDRVVQKLDKYDTIILAASWDSYLAMDGFEAAFVDTLKTLADEGKDVFVIGIVPRLKSFDRNCIAKKLKLPFLDCSRGTAVKMDEFDATNSWLKNITGSIANVSFVDLTNKMCTDGKCHPDLDGVWLYFDNSHLSVTGSVKLGKQFVTAEDIGALDRIAPSPANQRLPMPWRFGTAPWIVSASPANNSDKLTVTLEIGKKQPAFADGANYLLRDDSLQNYGDIARGNFSLPQDHNTSEPPVSFIILDTNLTQSSAVKSNGSFSIVRVQNRKDPEISYDILVDFSAKKVRTAQLANPQFVYSEFRKETLSLRLAVPTRPNEAKDWRVVIFPAGTSGPSPNYGKSGTNAILVSPPQLFLVRGKQG